jgi:DNA gyrase subunit A
VLWTNRAGLFATRLADIPSTAGYGAPLQALFDLEDGEFPLESIVVASPLAPTAGPTTGKRRSDQPADLPAERWLLVTESGRALFWQQPITITGRAGRRVARLGELEDVVHCARAAGDLVTVLTRSGTVHTVRATEVPLLARAARGVQLVRLRRGDRIVGVVSHTESIPPVVIGRDGKEHPLVPLTIGKPGESGHEPGRYDAIGLVAGTRREARSGRSRSRGTKRRR